MSDLQLATGERVAWTGQPARARYALEALPRFKIGAVFFGGGIFLCLFAFGIEAAAKEVWPCLLPLLASVAGLAMMCVLPLRYRHANGLRYYITNDRAIIYEENTGAIRQSFAFESFPTPAVLEYGDGTCDVVFDVDAPPRSDETDLEHSASVIRHGLIAVEEGTGMAEWLTTHLETCKTSQ